MQENPYLGHKYRYESGIVMFSGATYYVSGYAGPNHSMVRARVIKEGELLVTTWNRGTAKDTEVEVWRARMMRGEVSKITVSLNYRIVETYTRTLKGGVVKVLDYADSDRVA